MVFKLHTIGWLRLLDPMEQQVPFPEKGLIILAYLYTCPQRFELRSTLAKLLWDNLEPAQAYANLRKTLSRMDARQQELGARFLETSPTQITLLEGALECDLAALQAPPSPDPLSDLRLLAGLPSQLFLDRIENPGRALGNWIYQQQRSHLSKLSGTLMEAIPHAKSASERALVRKSALEVFQHDPNNEAVLALLNEEQSLAEAVPAGTGSIIRQIHGDLKNFPRGDEHFEDPATRSLEPQPANALDPAKNDRGVGSTETAAIVPRSVPRLVLLPPLGGTAASHKLLPFAEALIEDVTIGLCSLASVSVIAPYTAAQIGRQSDKAETIARHAISYVLDTKLSVQGGQPSLFAQLIYFANDEVIWADRYDMDADKLAEQRRQIAARIAIAIGDQIKRNEVSREYFESSPVAYHHYLLGQRHLKHLTLPDIRRARREFRTALTDSRYFSPALSGIARTYAREWLITARGDAQLLKEAEKYAGRAIETGEGMVAGYKELGVATLLLGNIDGSVEALELAEKLSPHYADVAADYADTLVHASQPREALVKIEKAIDLNPLSPDVYLWTAAGASYCLGNYQAALSYIGRMSDRGLANRLSAASWAMLGDQRRARYFVRKARDTNPDFEIDTWLAAVPFKEQWQKDHYREGLRKAGF
ncbi:hypothetical protein [Oryzifoliimicrobium ureilyticus]|uniref:hypothetical protein n=1 Tax=Oryzifoliimicrobium ureilyticus TaxID=3113724 RepID=UPI0030764533